MASNGQTNIELESDDRAQMEELRESVQLALSQMASIVARYLEADPQEHEAIFRLRHPGRTDWIQILEGRETSFSACYSPGNGTVSLCGRPPASSLRRDLSRIENAAAERGFDTADTILTSHDELATTLRDDLAVTDVASGFQRWLLPIALASGTASLIVGAPNSATGTHSHNTRTLHVIVNGSATINNQDLSPGDWAYIPRGAEYSFQAGPEGATSFYYHD